MATNLDSITTLDKVIDVLTDYHANGAYEKLKENVTLLDKESYAVMIRTTNFESNDFKDNLIYVDEHAYNYLKKSKVYASDLIMNKIANPGTVYFMPKLDKPVSLGMNLFLIRINTEKANPYFIYAYLKKNEHYVKSFASGSTTKTITKDDVRRLQIYSPPIEEQNKIAEILSTWDKAIEAVEKLVANSQQQKKALMQQLLTGKKRLLDKNGVKFSDDWEKTRLGVLLKEEKTRNKDNSISRVLSVTNHSGFILPENQFSKRVASDEVSNYKVVKKGQFGYNPSRINVGSFARLDKYENGILSPMYVVFSISSLKLNSDYFNFWMQSHEANQRIKNSTQGSVRDSVGFNAMGSFPFQLPSIEEQEKIAQVLTTADQEIDLHQQQLNKLKTEKKALMQQLLTGKKRVKA